jgi:hypothetical protein
MTREQVVWRTAQPLWREGLATGAAFARPALLRFAGDDFMEQLASAVGPGGAGVGPLIAGSETWQLPGAGLGTTHERGDATPVKLFQPVHGRYYLVAASLVCRRYGHPDHATAPDRDERVSFVLRRLVPAGTAAVDPADPASFVEHGFFAAGGGGTWRPATAGSVAADEARLPVFPMTATGDGGDRRLLAGLVPVSRRESFEPVPTVAPDDVTGSDDPLAVLADTRLQGLEAAVTGLQTVLGADAAAEPALVRESLFFTMVDLALWLDGPTGHLKGSLDDRATVLKDSLGQTFAGALTWREALATALAGEATAVFEEGEDAPAPVARLDLEAMQDAVTALGVEPSDQVDPADPADPGTFPTETSFFGDVHDALPPPAPAGDGTGPPQGGPAALPGGPGIYVARCLYERPRCLPAERPLVSAPSRPFLLAPFHDPDAPARPVRIALPVDTSPGGLRKFPRSVSTVLSAELRKQVQRVSEETLRDGSVGPAGAIDFGMVCQLSLPIITICALILLMIIVAILNIVFFWMPLFKICAPVPKEG